MKTIAITVLVLCPMVLQAESMRCGSQLILKGSTSDQLLEYCGKPTEVVHNGVTHGLLGNTYTNPVAGQEATGDIVVETWTYNFGPNQFMERLRLENGVVVQIEDLGYGHD